MINLDGFVPFPPDIRGWNGNSKIFEELVILTQPKIIIEIGSWKGQSTITLAKACKKHNIKATIYAVDTWLGALEFKENQTMYGNDWDTMEKYGYPQVYYQFLSNLIHEQVVDMVQPIPNTSENAHPHLPNADLIYVDGNHTYKAVMEDLENYYPKLREGGIIFGDDYFLQVSGTNRKDGYTCGVKQAVDTFAKKNGKQVETKYNNYWVIRK